MNWKKGFWLETFYGLLIIFIVGGLALYFCPDDASHKVEPSPVMALTGEYADDGFRLKTTDENTVIITVLPKEPRKYIKALSAAVDKVEKDSGKKALQIVSHGTPATIFLYLEEDHEQPK